MKYFVAFLLLLISLSASTQSDFSGSFTVGGDLGKYYPVSFNDDPSNWGNNIPTELKIGRSSVHTNSIWMGSLQAEFKYHVSQWGHGSEFINSDIKSYSHSSGEAYNFIAGWQDVTWCNGDCRIIIWLKGGGTTYFFNANGNVNPVIYDGVVNASSYLVSNSTVILNYKISPDAYVNQFGISGSSAYYNSTKPNYFNGSVGIGTQSPSSKLSSANFIDYGIHGPNSTTIEARNLNNNGTGGFIQISGYTGNSVATYQFAGISGGKSTNLGDGNYGGYLSFWTTSSGNSIEWNSSSHERLRIANNGNIGIGTTTPTDKLTVNGSVSARKLIVTQNGWSDYVFAKNYKLSPLSEVESYIKINQHLPEVPSAKEVASKGINVGDTQALLLKKIEELTLYMIEQEKRIKELEKNQRTNKGAK